MADDWNSTGGEDDRDTEEIFADWLQRLEDEEWDGEDFRVLLRRHPSQAGDLKRLHKQWIQLEGIDHRVQPEDPPPAPSRGGGATPWSGERSLGAAAELVKTGRRLGSYELKARLGEGAFGVVWRARDLMLAEDVALKFFPRVLGADRLALLRMRREAKTLLSLTHDGIVRLHTITAKDGLVFLVQECLEGQTLEQLLEERLRDGRRGLEPEEVIWILEQVVEPLGYAHGQNITHRDLKPSNLMLDRRVHGRLGFGRERIKLCDFGLAFVASSALSQISEYRPSGTLPYMAPEVLMGRRPTPTADVYSLAITLYQLIDGETPFHHGDIATQVLKREAEPLDSGDPRLDEAIASALSKRPQDRPQSLQELLDIAVGRKRRTRPGRTRRLVGGAALLAGLAVATWIAPWGEAWSRLREAGAVLADAPRDEFDTRPRRPVSPDPEEQARIEFEAPFDRADGPIYVGTSLEGRRISGTIFGGDAHLYVNSVERLFKQKKSGQFSVIPSYSVDGVHKVEFSVGSEEVAAFEVVVDTREPKLERVAPELTELESATHRLELRIEDPYLAEQRLWVRPEGAEEETPLELLAQGGVPGVWIGDVPLEPGRNLVRVTARDHSGNAARMEFSLQRAFEPTALVQSLPPFGDVLSLGSELDLELRFSRPLTHLEIGGSEVVVDSEVARHTLDIPDREGAWQVPWKATDIEGRVVQGQLDYDVQLLARDVLLNGRPILAVGDEVGLDRWPMRVRDPFTGITFRLQTPGSFLRPSDLANQGSKSPREARILEPYYLAETETTVRQFGVFVESSGYQTDAQRSGGGVARDTTLGKWSAQPAATWQTPLPIKEFLPKGEHPVTQVSHGDATAFCDHFGYRLPTEIEWEWGAVRDRPEQRPWGHSAGRAKLYGNYGYLPSGQGLASLPEDVDGSVFPNLVAQYLPHNGLYDMFGNVWEWCADVYHPRAWESEGATAGQLASQTSGAARILKGGSWLTSPQDSLAIVGRWEFADRASDACGFRAAFSPQGTEPPTKVTSTAGKQVEGKRRVTWALPSGVIVVDTGYVRDAEGLPLFQGSYEDFHANGLIRTKGQYENGLRKGRWVSYAQTGEQRVLSGNYMNGLRNGNWRRYSSGGDLIANGDWDQGRREGRWEFFRTGGAEDLLRSGRYKWSLAPRAEGALLDGERHGHWVLRWATGKVMAMGSYQRGRQTGPWRFYHPDGSFDPYMLSGIYRSGVRTELLPGVLELHSAPPTVESEALRSAADIAGVPEAFDPAVHARLRRVLTKVDEGPRSWPSELPALVLRKLIEFDLQQVEQREQALQLLALLNRPGGSSEKALPKGKAGRNALRLRILRAISLHGLLQRHRAQDGFWLLDPHLPDTAPVEADHEVWSWANDVHVAQLIACNFEERATPARNFKRWREEQEALRAGVRWLVDYQSANGSWSCAEFATLGVRSDSQSTGGGAKHHDVGVTGLALAALIEARSQPRPRELGSMQRAAAWLVSQQDKQSGWIGLRRENYANYETASEPAAVPEPSLPRLPGQVPGQDQARQAAPQPRSPLADGPTLYDHAIATWALAKALEVSPSPTLRRHVQLAVDALVRARNPYGGWRYGVQGQGDTDTSITGWCALALLSAEQQGLTVDPACFQGARSVFEEMSDTANGRVGYYRLGSPPARLQGVNQFVTTQGDESSTAIALAFQLIMPGNKPDSALMGRHADLLMTSRPQSPRSSTTNGAPNREAYFPYYWYFGTLAMTELGGRRSDLWIADQRKALLRTQEQPEPLEGSWPPDGPWGRIGGRVYSTSLGVLTLARLTLQP